MSGVRQSLVFAMEDEYGVPAPINNMWYSPPIGSWFSSSHSRAVQRINEVGRKKWTDVNYGKISGTWQWQFPMDYERLEPFMFVFEDYKVEIEGKWAFHSFSKHEDMTVPSFTVRRKQLNRITGGGADEVSELYGCVCTGITLSNTGSTSKVMVNMSGIYADESTTADFDLESLDRPQGDYNLVRWGCVHYGDEEETWGHVQNWSVKTQNSLQTVYGVGNPLARSYYEKETKNTFMATIYSDDPRRIRMRAYTGGIGTANSPVFDGAKPIPKLRIVSHAGDEETYGNTTYETKVDIAVKDCVISQTSWPNADGSAIMDSINGNCQDISMVVTNQCVYDYREQGHLVESRAR